MGPEGRREGRGEQFEILPEKRVPHRRPGGSPVAGREGAVFVPPRKEALRLPGRESLHPTGKAALGQLVGGERAGKAHPQHPVPVRDGGQDTGGESEIAGGLGQSQRLQ